MVGSRRRGLRLRATDSDLVLGDGAVVEGTTGDLLLAPFDVRGLVLPRAGIAV